MVQLHLWFWNLFVEGFGLVIFWTKNGRWVSVTIRRSVCCFTWGVHQCHPLWRTRNKRYWFHRGLEIVPSEIPTLFHELRTHLSCSVLVYRTHSWCRLFRNRNTFKRRLYCLCFLSDHLQKIQHKVEIFCFVDHSDEGYNRGSRLKRKLFEYDKRFASLGDFVYYDYNEPQEILEEYHHSFDVVIADPPYLVSSKHSK